MQSASSILGVAGGVRRLVARGRSLATPSCPGVALPSVYQLCAEAAAPPAPPGSLLAAAPGHASDWGHPRTLNHASVGGSGPAESLLRDAQDAAPALEPLAAGGPLSMLRWHGTSLSVPQSSLPGAHSAGPQSVGPHSAGVSGGLFSVGQPVPSRHWTRGAAQPSSSYFPPHPFQHPCCLLSTQGAGGDAPATPQPTGPNSESGAADPVEGAGSGVQFSSEGVEGGEGVLGAASTEGAEGGITAEGTTVADGPLESYEAPSGMGSELANAPRRVQRFMIQKMLKVKPTEPPSTAGLRKKFQMRIVDINRTAKVTKGGKVISFAALVVCGNGEGLVGFGRGKSAEVGAAVDKAFARSLRNLHYFERYRGRTVASEQVAKYGKTKVYLWPAAKGSSMSAGTTVGGILRLAGFTEVKTKVIGSRNPINTVKATFKALGLIDGSSESAADQAALG